MRKTEFVVVEIENSEVTIASGIKNDFEKQMDCDYFQLLKEEGVPIEYEVTVTVKRVGKLKSRDD